MLGHDPETGETISLRSGRFGPYVQLGEGEKPKRASIPKGTDASNVDLELCAEAAVAAARSRQASRDRRADHREFRPLRALRAHRRQYASLESPEDVFTIGINHAVTLIAEKKAKGVKRARAGGAEGTGRRSASGAMIKLMRGRYGPYVTDGTTNATVPERRDPLTSRSSRRSR